MTLFGKKKKNAHFAADAAEGVLHKNLKFTAVEQYKLLRTNLDFTLPEGVKCPVIGITSPTRGEGKSTTAINLSYVLAERGDRVLLLDGDLRLPSIASKMKISATPGLTDALLGRGGDIEQFRSELLDNWYIMPAGSIPPNPSELLGSKRMETMLATLRERFDYIVLDLPPSNLVADALSVSNLVTGMVLIIREEHTEKKDLERCMRQLSLSNVKLLGCVMNGAKTGGRGYGRYKARYEKSASEK